MHFHNAILLFLSKHLAIRLPNEKTPHIAYPELGFLELIRQQARQLSDTTPIEYSPAARCLCSCSPYMVHILPAYSLSARYLHVKQACSPCKTDHPGTPRPLMTTVYTRGESSIVAAAENFLVIPDGLLPCLSVLSLSPLPLLLLRPPLPLLLPHCTIVLPLLLCPPRRSHTQCSGNHPPCNSRRLLGPLL